SPAGTTPGGPLGGVVQIGIAPAPAAEPERAFLGRALPCVPEYVAKKPGETSAEVTNLGPRGRTRAGTRSKTRERRRTMVLAINNGLRPLWSLTLFNTSAV